MKNKFKKLLLIDLDGVLNEYDGNLHIDDRCICFKGDYDLSLKQIQEFKVHWKK